ncbi:hypothetical protein EUX98_g253 [Antrodiella citrinella]|uniref:Uncharacterized protein n=1 Tax=Antrodiella citrinella TaxID=2447956 RepID=A0A4S4N497_9APHY|nr:hypothetical protein EUX98_g253 [Antrodiella citrinella]
MRKSFANHYRDIMFTESELRQKTHEEIAIIHAVLWTQLQIVNNGVALGSIVIHNDNTPTGHGDFAEFELHYLVALCEALLASNALTVSEALSDYLAENRTKADEYMCFDTSSLAYIASVLKLPPITTMPTSSSSDLLSAGHPELLDESTNDSQHPYEIVPLAHLRDQLGDAFGVISDAVARHFLNHLQHLGLLQPVGHGEELFDNAQDPKEQLCCFPLPLGFDVSADIETLVAAIEACLQDLDLSINEIGFLLLTKRFWPDGMLSDYTFRRLTKALLLWIFSEDDNLATILRDFVARGRTLPGVRIGIDNPPWPNSNSRPIAANASSNGGDYVAARRALARRYVSPWLLAFHDKDVNAYAVLLYDLTAEHAEGGYTDDYTLIGISEDDYKSLRAAASDKILKLIMKICQASVVFTAFEDIYRKWLQRAYILDSHDKPPLSLSKLFNKEVEASQRYSTMVDPRMTMQDLSVLADANPLRDLLDTAKASADGFAKGLHWLCLFVSSGVEIPISLFREYASLAHRFKSDLETCSLLVKATLWSCWMRSIGRQDLQGVIASVHTLLSSEIRTHLHQMQRLPEIIMLIRQSLAACLLLFGCDRAGLIELGMIEERDIEHLPSRRKMQSRGSEMLDPTIIDSALTNALRYYVREAVDNVSCLIAKFFNAFANDSPFVESYEVDNFILRNGSALCTCAWQFYGIDMTAVCTIRTSFLLRLLVVDSLPFQTLVSELLTSEDWEVRLHTAHRLFQIVTDVTSPAFSVEDRQWRPSVIDIFYFFFSSLWLDDKEEVRLAIETWTQTLLPPHFDAIALCWSEALNKIPVADRVKLVSFLSQLRSHFPTWRVLTWDAIMESLLENDFMQRNGDSEDGPASAHLSLYGLSDRPVSMLAPADSDLVVLQSALVSLSIRMIADGLEIDVSSALKLKGHAYSLIGFRDVSPASAGPNGHSFYVKAGKLAEITSWSHPCLSDLTLLFDSAHPLLIAPSAMGSPNSEDDTPTRLLVGSVFADLMFEIFIQARDLESLPPITLKNLLKAMVIAVYKQDFDSKPLRHLQASLRRAVRRILDLLVDPAGLNYESRQLCLTVCQAFIKAWPSIVGVFLCDALESTAKMLQVLNYEQNVDDPLVEQTRAFLETNLMIGVINALFKRRLDKEFFEVLKFLGETPTRGFSNSSTYSRLRELLLRDVLTRCVDNDVETFQLVVDNIGKYVETAYHSQYSSDFLQVVGHSITTIARRTADWSADTFNASPLLSLAATLIQHNKGQSREFLNLTEGFLRVALVRSYLSPESLTRILQVTASIYRKAGSPDQCLALNQIASYILEQVTDKLNHKAHVTSSTLVSLLEVFTAGPDKEVPIQLTYERLALLADAGFAYLYAEGQGTSSLSGFAASQAVANLVLQIAEDQPQILSKIARSVMPVRAWNLVLLAALSSNSTAAAAILFDHFQGFAFVYYRSLAVYQNFNYDGSQEVVHAEISRAYASIKLWLLLCRKATAIQEVSVLQTSVNAPDKEGALTRRIWNELWPPFESVLVAIESDPQAESYLQITESPGDASLDHFVQQTKTEIWAEEKLEAAKREETMKNPAEKPRSRVPLVLMYLYRLTA